MNTMIDSQTGINLFLMMYALCLSGVTTTALQAIFPFGVGHIFADGILHFVIRAAFFFVFFSLCSIAFILGLRFCDTTIPVGFSAACVYVLFIIFLSMSPWFCDHLARICFLPSSAKVPMREAQFKYVDLLFVALYSAISALLFAIWYLIRR